MWLTSRGPRTATRGAPVPGNCRPRQDERGKPVGTTTPRPSDGRTVSGLVGASRRPVSLMEARRR